MFNWHLWDSHKQRLATSFALVVPVGFILGAGPYWSWTLLLATAASAALWELEALLFQERLTPPWYAFYLAVGLLFPLGTSLWGAVGLHAALISSLFLGMISLLFFSPRHPSGFTRISLLNLCWLYIPYLLSYVLLIGRATHGRSWMFFIFFVIVAGDAGAFYFGSRFGTHKLYESVSPKKTVEGSFGGLMAGMVAGTIFGGFFFSGVQVWKIAAFSALLGIVGQLGDLVESKIKRMSGKKDSSQLLPGHGGVLDRLDSLLFAFPATWLFTILIDR